MEYNIGNTVSGTVTDIYHVRGVGDWGSYHFVGSVNVNYVVLYT